MTANDFSKLLSAAIESTSGEIKLDISITIPARNGESCASNEMSFEANLQDEPTKDWLTKNEAMKFLGFKATKVGTLANQGKILRKYKDKKPFFYLDSLQAYIDKGD